MNNLEICKFLYEISIIKGKPIDLNCNIMKNSECTFTAFAFILMETPYHKPNTNDMLQEAKNTYDKTKWLYNQAIEAGYTIHECASEDGIIGMIKAAVKSNSYLNIPWLYDMGIKLNIKFNDDFIKKLFKSALKDMYIFDMYTVQTVYNLRPNALNVGDHIKSIIDGLIRQVKRCKRCNSINNNYSPKIEDFIKIVEEFIEWLIHICPDHKNKINDGIKLKKLFNLFDIKYY